MIKDINIQNETSNIHFLNRTNDIADLTAYAQENNIVLFYMDGFGVFSQMALLRNLGVVIRSPVSHKQSWDKFRADMTDLSWIAPSNGFFLVYESYKDILAHNPRDWITFLKFSLDAIEFWKQTKTPLHVFFSDPVRVRKENKVSLLGDSAPRQLASYATDIHFLNQTGNISEIVNYAQENNMEFFHLDGSKITSKKDLLLQVGNVLRFPDYYGQNWDALNDCIRDLKYWISSRDGYILFYKGFENFLFRSPKEWIVFLEILLTAIEFHQRYKSPLFIFLQLPANNELENSIAELIDDVSDNKEFDSVLANSELFTLESYQEFMIYIKDLGEQLEQLRTASKKQRVKSPKSDEWRNISAKYRQTSKLYRLRLHQHTVAVCPYCGESVIKPFDHFSLLGLYGHLNIDYTYVGNIGLNSRDVDLGRHCTHALFTMQFVNFNHHKLDDLPTWAANHLHLPSSYRLDFAPYVLVWPLIARRTSAVIHALPIGRYDDSEPQHYYTSYFVTYFADGKNSNIGSFWKSGEDNVPTPALYGDIYKNYDLVKWVKAKRLLWVDPSNTGKIADTSITNFPYENIQPQGWYRIEKDRSVDGPHPKDSNWLWSGTPPHHDQSFPRPIDI